MLAIIDPFSGIAGDMFLGALVDLGLDQQFVEELPATLGLDGVAVRIARTQRCGIGGVKVDFDIPPQPHGRHLKQILEIVDRSPAPGDVKAKASEAFRLMATVEAGVHGTTVERVHLHEVGAIDAILDVVGSVWGLSQLGVTDACCGTVALGEGFVDAAHGRMPVPAPATAKLLEGLLVSMGPTGAGELTTPTGAALLRVLVTSAIPSAFAPKRTGYGAGTREFPDRPNLLRITLAERTDVGSVREVLFMLAADIDDMSAEHLASAAEDLRAEGARDVTLSSVSMKKGRLGTRLEVLALPADADRLEQAILMKTSSIGVRRTQIFRYALPREHRLVSVEGHSIQVKVVQLPDGTVRLKPEFEDVRKVTVATGLSMAHISAVAVAQAQRSSASV